MIPGLLIVDDLANQIGTQYVTTARGERPSSVMINNCAKEDLTRFVQKKSLEIGNVNVAAAIGTDQPIEDLPFASESEKLYGLPTYVLYAFQDGKEHLIAFHSRRRSTSVVIHDFYIIFRHRPGSLETFFNEPLVQGLF